MSEAESLSSALQKALYLEANDLEQNRAGHLTAKQIARLEGQMRAAWVGIGCLLVLTLLFMLFLAIVVDYTILRVLVAGIFLGSLVSFFRSSQKIRQQHEIVRQDIAAGKVASVQGPLLKQNRGKAEGYFFKVGENAFPVSKALYDATHTGRIVEIYFLPASQQLLSMTYLDAGEFLSAEEEEDETV